jgi:hypothetical protein
MFSEAAMAESWDGVGKAAMVGTHKAQERGFWVGAMLTLVVKPQWVCCKLDETIEQSCSDFLAHTLEACKSACQYNEYSAIQG